MTRSRSNSLTADVAAGRELAALVDGPWAPRWYWRNDLEAMQDASRRMGHPDGHPGGDHVTGRVWRYQPGQTVRAAA